MSDAGANCPGCGRLTEQALEAAETAKWWRSFAVSVAAIVLLLFVLSNGA